MWLIQKERRLLSILSTVFKAFKKEISIALGEFVRTKNL